MKNLSCFVKSVKWVLQTLQKPLEANEGSRKSSTCHPGSVSIKYSDILLVEYEALSVFDGIGLISTEAELEISLETVLNLFVVAVDGGWVLKSVLVVEIDEVWLLYKLVEAESFTPVRRNLLCFCVCSLALWIEMSHSLQRIALSSWQNRNDLLSCQNRSHMFAIKRIPWYSS